MTTPPIVSINSKFNLEYKCYKLAAVSLDMSILFFDLLNNKKRVSFISNLDMISLNELQHLKIYYE